VRRLHGAATDAPLYPPPSPPIVAAGLFKRVRHVALQTVEQHIDKDRFGGLALIVDVLGKRQELYFYRGARVDGLLKRVHDYGIKISEFYGDTPNRLWYRSVTLSSASSTPAPPTLMTPPGRDKTSKAAASALADMPSALTVEVGPPRVQEVDADDDKGAATSILTLKRPGDGDGGGGGAGAAGGKKRVNVPVEQAIRKMTEKYRRHPTGAVPAHLDMAKVIYLLDERKVQVNFHHDTGRITACSRVYSKPSGKFEQLSVDPFAPVPRVSCGGKRGGAVPGPRNLGFHPPTSLAAIRHRRGVPGADADGEGVPRRSAVTGPGLHRGHRQAQLGRGGGGQGAHHL